MIASTAQTLSPCKASFDTAESRWHALETRNRAAVGAFVYGVRTTGVYCRPACPSRLAKRENITFYDTPEQARAAGLRACLRCKPDAFSSTQETGAAIAKACRIIEDAETPPNLETLAEAVGMSPFHFHRQFKAATGVTPRAYGQAKRADRVRAGLARPDGSVTSAIYDAGFNASSRFYEGADAMLGMTPKTYQRGGAETEIRFAVGECSLGSILVAQSAKGVCAILLGDDPERLVHDLQDRFPKAKLVAGDAGFEKTVAQVVGFVDQPRIGLDLPLDISGTAFQQRVWQALRTIPVGTTASYAEIARKIGQPSAVRAVAQACANNAIAVAIPCHRVVRTDGGLSGYRWGVERKQVLLDREAS